MRLKIKRGIFQRELFIHQVGHKTLDYMYVITSEGQVHTQNEDLNVKRTTEQCFQAKILSHHFVTKSWKSEVKTPCGSLGGG